LNKYKVSKDVAVVKWKYACPAFFCKTWSDKPGICPTHNIKMIWSKIKQRPKFWVFGIKKKRFENKPLNNLLRSD